MHERARERVANDVLRQLRDLYQFVHVDAGVDAHFLTEEGQIFGADIARSAL